MAKLSVQILTKNEATFIARAIASTRKFADEVVVVDCGSEDDTAKLAERLGARVVMQSWLGWVGQRNVGLANCSNDWVMSLEADEIVTPELADSIFAAMNANPDPKDGFVVTRVDEFLGQLMPNMQRAQKRRTFVRLFNKRFSNWDPEISVHEYVLCPGSLHILEGDLIHWRNYTISQQMQTLNRNAELESDMIFQRGKQSLVKMTLKPFARFLWIYLICGAWRRGARGYIWARLHATAEFLRQSMAWERARVIPMPHPPESVVTAPNKQAEGSVVRSPQPVK